MAKYHWERITDDPDLYRELMIIACVEDEDEDALWLQLPDVCSEGGRPMGSGRTPTQPEPKTVSFR